MARKTWLANVQEKMGLVDGKSAREVGKDKENEEKKTGCCSFLRPGKKEGMGESYSDHYVGQNGEEKSPGDEAHMNFDSSFPVEESTEEAPYPLTMHPVHSSTPVGQQSELLSGIVIRPSLSIDVPSEPVTHPDFENLGPNQASEPCSKRIAKHFEERISAPVKKSWPYRRLSMRRSKTRDGISNTEGAGENTSERHLLKPLQPTLPTRTPNQRTSLGVQDPNEPTHVNGGCINSARRVAFSIAPSPIQTPPHRPKCPIFNQAAPSPTSHHPLLSSPDASMSSPNSSSVYPPPGSLPAPELHTLPIRSDCSTTQIQQHSVPLLPNGGSISSLVSALTSSPPHSANSLLQQSPDEQALWTECGSRLDSVAAEAAEQARARLRKERKEDLAREDLVVQQATIVRRAKAKLVTIRPPSNKLQERNESQVEAGLSTEMQERKRVPSLPWEAAWHNPHTASQDELVPYRTGYSSSTLSTMEYSMSGSAYRGSTPPGLGPMPANIPTTHHRIDSLDPSYPLSKIASSVDREATNNELSPPPLTGHRHRDVISYHSTTVSGPKSVGTFADSTGQRPSKVMPKHCITVRANNFSHTPTKVREKLSTNRPSSPREVKSASFGHSKIIPRSPEIASTSGEPMSTIVMTEQRDEDNTEEETVDDWHSCCSEIQEEDRDGDLRRPLLEQYMGRC